MKDILFVHIPKTGGSSITKALEDRFKWNPLNKEKWKPLAPMPPVAHDPLFLLETINDLTQFYVFSVVRNPYTRVYSLYHHYKRISRSEEMSFNNFLLKIKPNIDRFDESHFYSAVPTFINFISYSQKFFLRNSFGNRIIKLYRFENLPELENDFGVQLSNYNSGGYSQEEYQLDYSQDNVDLVREIYYNDFIEFNYSVDFEGK